MALQQAFEDEDFLDPDTDTRLTKLIGMRSRTADGAGTSAPQAVRTGSVLPQASASAGQAAAPATVRGIKRPRSPEPGAASGAGGGSSDAGAGSSHPAKAARVLDAEELALLAAIEADSGITFAQFKEALTSGPPPTIAVR